MSQHNQEPDLGTVIGGCRLKREIGRGGMGVVYLAEQVALGRQAAVKVIAPALARDEGFRQRFERESRLAASIDHTNIVPVYAAGEQDGRLYIVMRYVRGTDLRDVIDRGGGLEPSRAARITAEIAAALDAAHGAGLVHRDVKPANVLLANEPDGECAYLTDFGLTKRTTSQSGVTAIGQWVGTIDYVAPEQLEHGMVDARTDIYALGCVLFEMVAGTVPYAGSEVQKMSAHVNLPPPSLADAAPHFAPVLDPVIRRAMAKQPGERFPSAGDLARAATAAIERGGAGDPQRTRLSATPTTPAAPAVTPPASEAETRAVPATATPGPAPAHPAASAPRSRLALVLAAVAVLAVAAAGVLLVGGGGGGGDDGAADTDPPSERGSDVTGTAGADRLAGTDGDDVISADAGDDRVDARGGNDFIDGGEGADKLNGGPGDDEFASSEDDSVDVFTCGPGQDLVSRPDARDIVGADCDEAGWTARPADGRPYENRISVAPTIAGSVVSFEALCRAACEGVIELRTPTSRELLGMGPFELRPGTRGPVAANLNDLGAEQLKTGRNVRVVLRASRAGADPQERVNSGFTTRLGG